MKLTPDLIYEAALDDELFDQLPQRVAETFGARSCVLHWRDQAGAAEIATHSGYFSDEQMANYAANFVPYDLWTHAGMGQGFVNKAWRTTDLVPTTAYEGSVFYNEWIRQMGDDTFFCCGSVMQTVYGDGIVGLHRGRTQDDFTDGSLAELNQQVGHLRRMFAIRAKIAHVTERRDLLNAIFASSDKAVMALSASGRLLLANAAGDAMLRAARFLVGRDRQVRPAVEDFRQEFEVALARSVSNGDREASTFLLRSADGAMVIASLTPLPSAFREPAALLTVDARPERLPDHVLAGHLRRAFSLSPAEAQIALQLADGLTIPEIADRRRSTVATVRTQVKVMMLKMDARRQSDVVRIVVQLARGQVAERRSPEE